MSTTFSTTRRPLRPSRLAAALGLALGLGVLAAGAGAQALDPELLAQYQELYLEHFGSLQGFDDFVAAAWPESQAVAVQRPQVATRYVTNCNDSGAGSLRAILGVAQDGDTINLAGCGSVIELQSSLSTSADYLTLDGGSGFTILRGDDSFRILQHNGGGTLMLRSVGVEHGRMHNGVTRGGCISSLGSVYLDNAVVKYCSADRNTSSSVPTRGGAIYAAGRVTITGSSISHSNAQGYEDAYGGAIYAGNGVSLNDAEIRDNTVSSFSGSALGGAIYLAGGGINAIDNSSIEDNRTSASGPERGGGIAVATNSGLLFVRNSVVTGNSMFGDDALGGGLFVDSGNALSVQYSDITANQAGQAGGILSRSGVSLQFSTVADNEATVKGGAIIAHSGTVKLENCTISGNKAPFIGGSELNTTTGGTIRIDQCTITGNRTVDGIHQDWGFGTGLVLLKKTVIRNSTITDNGFDAKMGETAAIQPGRKGVGITLGPNVQLEISSSVLAANWRIWLDDWQTSDLAVRASSSWSGDHNAVMPGGAGLEPNTIPPGNLEIDLLELKLGLLKDNGGWTRTMLPTLGSKLINAGLANGFDWDQRGEPWERVQAGAADIGAAESCQSDLIFRNSFEITVEPPLCGP